MLLYMLAMLERFPINIRLRLKWPCIARPPPGLQTTWRRYGYFFFYYYYHYDDEYYQLQLAHELDLAEIQPARAT